MDKLQEIFGKIQALGTWKDVLGNAWAIKPMGVAYPYLLVPSLGVEDHSLLHLRILEGWQSFHNFIFLSTDANYGCLETLDELAQFVLVKHGKDPLLAESVEVGYAPTALTERQIDVVATLLWETYGIMLRAERDGNLMMKFSDDRAIFGRLETKRGVWEDHPFIVPRPMPYCEKVSFAKEDISKLKDLPLKKEVVLDVDFARSRRYVSGKVHPRNVYRLVVVEEKHSGLVATAGVSIARDLGVHEIWEQMPGQLVKILLQSGMVPGEIKVRSQRVFRLLRALCMEVPFKLSMHDKLSTLDAMPNI